MAAPFQFDESIVFSPENSAEILRSIPTLPGVFALRGPREEDQPYLTRAADLRRRITRILAPPDSQSKRLNLRDRVARIDYTITGSEFESTFTLYHAAATIFGLDQARRRLKLRTPFFLRFTAENAYPRVYSTNRLSKRALDNFYGPFPSRAAADRYCDAVLDLFKLRRCVEDLAPYPEHPGCVYQEMKKCLAPCNQACTPAGAAAYEAEAAAVKRFFDTRGESMVIDIGLAREEASNALHFERAAELHAQWHKVKAAQSLADELVQPLPKLRAILVQKAAQSTAAQSISSSSSAASDVVILSAARSAESKDPRILPAEPPPPGITSAEPTAAIFLLQSGCITGPERLSTLGVRAVKEQTSVGSSLFAQPLMLQAIPLEDSPATPPVNQSEARSAESEPTAKPVILSEARSAESEPTAKPVIQSEARSAESEPTAKPVILSEARSAESEPTAKPVILSEARSAESKDPGELDIANAAHGILPPPPEATAAPTLNPELRATNLIAALEEKASAPTDLATLSDHLSLLRRWYYRPEKQRTGEVFFPREDHTWPIRRILRGAARMALGEPKPMAETHRELVQRNPADEAQKPTRTRTLHEGRPDVERTVPVIDQPRTFKSRRKSQPTEPR